MTLVQLRHLLALADSGSFSRAAEAVHLTQPALSRSIQTLEDELGQPLFDRLGRHSELTPFGRAMAVRARQVLDDADALRDHGRRIARGEAPARNYPGMDEGLRGLAFVTAALRSAREASRWTEIT